MGDNTHVNEDTDTAKSMREHNKKVDEDAEIKQSRVEAIAFKIATYTLIGWSMSNVYRLIRMIKEVEE